jgi:hypothetical protein
VALHFVDTDGMRGSRERRGPGGALRNETEVRVAAHVVRLLDERCPTDLSMAVIAMYAEQVERLRQALGHRKFKRSVKIDTVDSFEGREEDLVVISLVRSNERGRIGFLRVPNRLNVAISRAKRLVACIGDADTLRSGEESMYGVLVEAARAGGGYMHAADVVSPPKRRADRQRSDEAAVGGGEGAPGRRRRRHRRRGQGSVSVLTTSRPVASPEGEAPPIPSPAGGAVGPDQAQRRHRRRRRRHGPRPELGTAPVGGAAAPPAGQAPPASGPPEQIGLHFEAEGTMSFRPHRRRHRGPRPGGGSPGAGPGSEFVEQPPSSATEA